MKRISLALALCGVLNCCQPKKREVVVLPEESLPVDVSSIGKLKLSDYGFFKGALKDLSPSEEVIPYTINAALFSDYAFKKRFVKIPKGSNAVYSAEEIMAFPEGTVLIKNFYYPCDFRKPNENLRIIETRLLIRTSTQWETLPYVWNEEQTDAFLTIGGKNIDVSWTNYDGIPQQVKYSVPNMIACKGCHLKNHEVLPIGPSARQLNRTHDYPSGVENQLAHWKTLRVLEGLPASDSIPALANYENKDETVERRARAWLEVNCAHCHRSDGPARNSGLYLLATEKNLSRLGVGKAPVAAGKGSGGLLYGIVPGHPLSSILQFRIESTDPGIMMPELGRKVVHTEGVELVRQWISEMKPVTPANQ